jgi:hypothetical protein
MAIIAVAGVSRRSLRVILIDPYEAPDVERIGAIRCIWQGQHILRDQPQQRASRYDGGAVHPRLRWDCVVVETPVDLPS